MGLSTSVPRVGLPIKLGTRHISHLAWVVMGVALTAMGTLVGVRVLTQFVDPKIYGEVSLALGITTLAVNLFSTPLSQAGIYFYPSMLTTNSLPALHAALTAIALRMLRWFVPVFATVLALMLLLDEKRLPVSVALGALVGIEFWRSLQLSMLNAARLQGRYAIWSTADAWLRPLLGAAAILAFGQSSVAVLAAYVVVSIGTTLLLQTKWWGRESGTALERQDNGAPLIPTIWRYAIPLVPLGILGWLLNVGDRYLIGALLSAENVGTYAAVYGLSSAPVTIIGGTVELLIRPVYQSAVSAKEGQRARRCIMLWLGAVIVGCGAVELVATIWHVEIANLFLGPAFRHEAHLIPWIAGGYAIRCVAYVFERACYAHGHTKHVLVIQLCSVAAAVVATPVGIVQWGVLGAAMAVPVYFSVQLIASMFFAAKATRGAVYA